MVVLVFFLAMVAIVLVKFASYDVTAWQVWLPVLTVVGIVSDWVRLRWSDFRSADY